MLAAHSTLTFQFIALAPVLITFILIAVAGRVSVFQHVSGVRYCIVYSLPVGGSLCP